MKLWSKRCTVALCFHLHTSVLSKFEMFLSIGVFTSDSSKSIYTSNKISSKMPCPCSRNSRGSSIVNTPLPLDGELEEEF